ncbi:anti-sigma factor domain-containing protein [Neobacillus vireti]|uniref:anti-sigma factor domain-containing protein n=1 Tax=Neobacillus vireti TaxID=220686 RepID=UPI002FFD6D06
MRKGIVLEVNDPYLTLLTPEGEFLRARKMDQHYSIGEEICFSPVTDYLNSKKNNPFKNFFTLKKVWMSIAVLVICIGSMIPVYQSNKAYAYMTIDAGTNIEMGLNKRMQVVELKGFTKEAKHIISQIEDWKKKDASELTSIILSELKDEGYIHKTEPVVISTVKTDQLKETVAAKLQDNIESIKQNDDKNLVEVKMYTSTQEEIEKAKNSGKSVGIYYQTKNESAQKNKSAKNKKSTKTEKIKHKSNAPSGTSTEAKLPPGQIKKQDETNNNPSNTNHNEQSQTITNDNIDQSVNSQNDINNPVVNKQKNGNQGSPGNQNKKQNKEQENPNQYEKHNKEQVNQNQNGNNKKINKQENENKQNHHNTNNGK